MPGKKKASSRTSGNYRARASQPKPPKASGKKPRAATSPEMGGAASKGEPPKKRKSSAPPVALGGDESESEGGTSDGEGSESEDGNSDGKGGSLGDSRHEAQGASAGAANAGSSAGPQSTNSNRKQYQKRMSDHEVEVFLKCLAEVSAAKSCECTSDQK